MWFKDFFVTLQKILKYNISVKIKDVICALERFAPLPLQEDYDNAGLQVGLTEADVSGVLLCLDVTEQVVEEAIAKGCNMIVAHHPLIFRKLSHISNENYVQRCVVEAIKKDITIVAMHTNLDNAKNGVNYMIAQKLGITRESIKPLSPRIVNDDIEGCSGIIGELPHPLTAEEYIYKVKETFGCKCVMTNEPLNHNIKTVAICGGAGAFLISQAVRAGADAFLTGEMRYHEYFGYEQELQITVIGHYESEQYTKELLKDIVNEKCPEVRTCISTLNTNPIRYW